MDKRKLNGGHSTKAKGVDKRKNEFRQAIKDAFDGNDVIEILSSLKRVAVTKGDTQAAKVFLEYTVGKPKETIDVHSTGNSLIDIQKLVTFNDEPSQQVSESIKE